jgi:hypothetical protein
MNEGKITGKCHYGNFYSHAGIKHYDIFQCFKQGIEIKMSVAVDFTLSNGHPVKKDSLHYFDSE